MMSVVSSSVPKTARYQATLPRGRDQATELSAPRVKHALVAEAREKMTDRGAISALRRRSLRKAVPGKASSTVATSAAPPSTPVKGAVIALPSSTTRRVLRLQSLPGTSTRHINGRNGAFQRSNNVQAATSESIGSNNSIAGQSSLPGASGVHAPDSAGSSNSTGTPIAKRVAVWWTGADIPGGRDVPPNVERTNALPTRLSCGYCRKSVRIQVLDRHEQSTASKKPLFSLFKSSRGEKTQANSAGSHDRVDLLTGCQEPLTEWKIGEGLRRPVPLRDEAKPEEDEEEDTPEAAASTWKRQRDDWLFGRHEDIPWLPKLSLITSLTDVGHTGGEGKNVYSERFETLGVSEGDSSHIKKAALRAASLRWHPDKFVTKYGPKLRAEDRQRVVKDVHVMMQRITKLKERLHKTDAAGEKAGGHGGEKGSPAE